MGDIDIEHDIKIKNLNQTLAIISDVAYNTDLSVIGPLHPVEAGDTVLLKIWKARSPED